jgi:adenylate kinase family enzyme
MKRVVILGPGASGKSTLAVYLSDITGLPVIELDKFFWQSALVATRRDQWEKIQQTLVMKDGWIMDGDLGPYDSVEIRLRAADTIIFLDFSIRTFCAAGCPPGWSRLSKSISTGAG